MKRKLYFTDFDAMGIEYFASQRVTKNDTREKGYRYVLSKPLTLTQKEAVMKYKNVIIGTCAYKYAPEIKHDTIILMDKCLK